MLTKNHPIILFIDRFGFSIYQDTLTNIPKFNFTPDLVCNLDVINKEQFSNLIATFIQINKIIPSSLAVILSDTVIYVKDLVSSVQKPAPNQDLKLNSDDDEKCNDEVQKFLENIPFEEVLAKVIKVENARSIVAVNKDLVMTIANAFSNKGSIIEAITPSFMYKQNANFTTGLTLDNIQVVLGNTETLKSGNLLTDQEKVDLPRNLEIEFKTPSVTVKKKPKNIRQFILIGVFILLLVILAVVYLNMGASQTPPKNSKVKGPDIETSEVVVTPTLIPTLIQEPTITPSMDFKTINIKISHDTQSGGIATNLKNALSGIGAQNISDEVSEDSVAEKSSVIFSQNIPANVKDIVITEIRKVLPDASVLEGQDANSTISISIGKS
jgi:hypothetical protein